MKMLSRRAQFLLALAVGGAAALAACGSDDSSQFGNGSDGGDGNGGDGALSGDGQGFGGGDSGSEFASLYFDPATATVVVDGSGPKTASFTLKGKKSDGTVVNVTPQSISFDHPGIATVTDAEPSVATSNGPYGGSGQIHAVYNGQSAAATLTVQIKTVDVGAGVAASAVTALNGVTATTPNDPTNLTGNPVQPMLYPYDQTVFPLGLASPTLQWNAPAQNQIYRLHYEEKNYTFDGYYNLATALGQMNLAQAAWDEITASNDPSTTPDPLVFKLYRYDGTNAYYSATESWTIAPASVNGAIYYWTTSGSGGLNRIQPGSGSAPTSLYGGKCMGCHGVSADGTTLVASVDSSELSDGGPSTYRQWVSFDLQSGANPAVLRKESDLFGANIAVNHNGKYVVFGDKDGTPPATSTTGLHFGDATTGTMIAGSAVETFSMESWTDEYVDPAFSPAGTKLATVQADAYYGAWQKSELMVSDFNEATTTFSGNKSLIRYDNPAFNSAQWSIGYPSFTPDDNFIAFHVADWGAGCFTDSHGNSCNAATQSVSSLWMINASTGGTPIKLNALNDSSPNAVDHNEAFEPTFNPIARGGYFWVVFTSERTWGNERTTHGTSGDKRLWVAAINQTTGATDPSHPPFYLESQANTMNMRGFWALAACTPTASAGVDAGPSGGTCTAGYECCSGFCDAGKCVDVTQLACKNIGDTCTQASDCCNSDVVACTGGKCEQPIR